MIGVPQAIPGGCRWNTWVAHSVWREGKIDGSFIVCMPRFEPRPPADLPARDSIVSIQTHTLNYSGLCLLWTLLWLVVQIRTSIAWPGWILRPANKCLPQRWTSAQCTRGWIRRWSSWYLELPPCVAIFHVQSMILICIREPALDFTGFLWPALRVCDSWGHEVQLGSFRLF